MIPVPVTDDGEIDLQALDALLDERVKMVAVNHVSNALGTINPVQEIAAKAHAVGALCMVDGAQAIAHWRWTCSNWAATFMPFPDTSCLARPALACSGDAKRCLKPCRPFWAEGK